MVLHKFLFFLGVFFLPAMGWSQSQMPVYEPNRFDAEIEKFEKSDLLAPPPEGGILFVGSSSIGFWNDKLREDMEPLQVIPRGFGGSTMHDVLHYAQRIIFPYKPRAIVLYEGDNDIGYYKLSPETVLDIFQALTQKIQQELPGTKIYVLSIKPSIARMQFWPRMNEVNRLIEEYCSEMEMLTYVDVASPMFSDSGALREDIFVEDQLHMNRKGYAIWTSVLKPLLLKSEGRQGNSSKEK